MEELQAQAVPSLHTMPQKRTEPHSATAYVTNGTLAVLTDVKGCLGYAWTVDVPCKLFSRRIKEEDYEMWRMGREGIHRTNLGRSADSSPVLLLPGGSRS